VSRPRSRGWVAVVAGLLLAIAGRFAGMPVVLSVLAAAMIGALVYTLFDPPGRYRRFGLAQRDQAVDHSSGQIGKTYPEDPVNR